MKSLIIALTVSVLTGTVLADSGGSAYSIFGIGDLRPGLGNRSLGMGYTGIGLHSTHAVNPLSAASWARINRSRLDAGMLYEGFKSADGSRSLYRASGNFDAALLTIPISLDNGIVFSCGFLPVSNVDYSMFTGGEQQGIAYTLHHRGRGGLGRGMAGLSYALSPSVSLGGTFSYYFGTIEHSRILSTVAVGSSGGASGGTTSENISMRGIVTSISGIFTGFGALTEELAPLSAGFVVSSRSKLNVTKRYIYQSAAETDSTDDTKGSLFMPMAVGFGLAFQAGERFLVATDFHTQFWSGAEFRGLRSDELRDSFRWGIGAERLPNREFSAPWEDRLALRFGFYYHGTYYRVDNQPVNEWGFTAGFGLPFGGDSRFNIAMEYGKRGSLAHGLIRDTIIRVNLSVSLSELWFIRFEEE